MGRVASFLAILNPQNWRTGAAAFLLREETIAILPHSSRAMRPSYGANNITVLTRVLPASVQFALDSTARQPAHPGIYGSRMMVSRLMPVSLSVERSSSHFQGQLRAHGSRPNLIH